MSREVRRVPMDWHHPMEWKPQWHRGETRLEYIFIPLLNRVYADDLAEFTANPDYYDGVEPDPKNYMPDFRGRDDLGYCMYEDVSEGTPISPVFETPEELAAWLSTMGANAGAGRTATYEQWLAVVRGGWAPSLVLDSHGLRSGVEAMGDLER